MVLSPDLPFKGQGIIENFLARGEPDWLNEVRRDAFQVFKSLPKPTNRDERWRYTELERFDFKGCRPVDKPMNRSLSPHIRQRISDSDADGVLVLSLIHI